MEQHAALEAVEVELDRVGVERLAVVELDAVAESDRPLRVVGVVVDRLREVRDVLTFVVGDGERVVDGLEHLDPTRRELRRRRAEATEGFGLEAIGERPAFDGLAVVLGDVGLCALRAAASAAAPARRRDEGQARPHGHDLKPPLARQVSVRIAHVSPPKSIGTSAPPRPQSPGRLDRPVECDGGHARCVRLDVNRGPTAGHEADRPLTWGFGGCGGVRRVPCRACGGSG